MSTLFLIGAGASFGSGPCAPSNPPLGWQLFRKLQELGGVAATVGEDLSAIFENDFEAGMDRFWRERNADTTPLLREMAGYFAQFEPLPGNLYLKLIRVLGGTRKKAVFATTNYDMLIELAICNSGLLVSYETPASDGNISVLKIHGSCNFLPTAQIEGIRFVMPEDSTAAIVSGDMIKVATSTREVSDFCDGPTALAPAIAMYHRTKRVLYCPEFVLRQQEAFHAAIREAKRIFVIGLKVHPIDEHIWQPLAAATTDLYYVGSKPELDAWAANVGRKRTFYLGSTFAEAFPKIAARLP